MNAWGTRLPRNEGEPRTSETARRALQSLVWGESSRRERLCVVCAPTAFWKRPSYRMPAGRGAARGECGRGHEGA